MYETAQRFERSGLITNALEHRYQFSAPIVRVMVGSRLFKARTSLMESTMDCDNFLRLSIERMRPLAFLNSLSHCDSEGARLLERQWQMEWALAASTAAPVGSTISPDVGPVHGSPGYLDFYIDGGLRWGVELMREGLMMAEHIKRFATKGIYKTTPFNRWALIDFWHNSMPPEKLEVNVWYAMYAGDFKHITIRRQGHSDLVLTLSGDDNLSHLPSP